MQGKRGTDGTATAWQTILLCIAMCIAQPLRLAYKFLPIFRWAGPGQLPEHSRKVLLILEPAGHRHVQYTHLGGTQHLLGALYPAVQHKLVRALAR